MRQVTFAFLASTVLWTCATSCRAEPSLSILFIGNSYTYVHDMPALIAGLAEAAGHKIETDQHTPGGCSFEKHVKDGKAAAKIGARKWDVVVLQEQSLRPLANPAAMKEYAGKLHEEIKRQGSQTVFYLTWARRDKPQTQEAINAAYFSAAKILGARAAPVGIAWQRAMKEDPKLVLYAKDGSHPSAEGSYLAACVFYAMLFDKSPEGLPAELNKGGKTLVKLDPALAKRLRAVAWKVVQEGKAK